MSLRSSESSTDPLPSGTPEVCSHPGEPAMYLQRPTSERSQDISHILSSTFRELFSKDAVSPETVKHLAESRAGRPSYNERYVERLQQVQSDWEQEVSLIDKLEAHIFSAESKARETEKEMTELAVKEWPDYDKLGLPPVPSQLLCYLDTSLLRSKNLITPEDFIFDGVFQVRPPPRQEHDSPNHYKSTASFHQRYSKTQPETNYRTEKNASAPPAKFSLASDTANLSRTSRPAEVSGQQLISEKKIHGVSADLKLRSVTKVWKESLKPLERQADREDLSRMQQKADFLKNPRFSRFDYLTKLQQNNRSDEPLENESTTNSFRNFAVFPCPVVFTDYEPGNVYEAVVRLKNVTSASRQLRVLPPSSKYFSVSLGQFPSENGVVAPGISCQYTIFFKPDSLADFYDNLQVVTLTSGSFSVPITAKRTPPELKLPAFFDCGYALVNTTKEIVFDCHNSGGPGRFCIMPQKHWPTVEWKHSLDCPGSLNLDGFHFEPAMCYLNTGDHITFKVTFSPTAVASYNDNILFVCDNCQVKAFEIKGVGELAGVELESIEGGFSEYNLGEFRDQSCQFLVRFKDQHPLSTEKRKLYIRNTTAVKLAYKWQISTPNLGGSPSVLPTELIDVSSDTTYPFSVSPSCGYLEPNSISIFDLIFLSKQVGCFHSVLNFILKKIPSNGSKDEFTDVLAISLELKGESKPHQILVSPPALFLGGEYLISTTFLQKILMGNSSLGDVQYYWPPFENDQVSISLQPEHGMLGREEKVEIDVFITGKKAGRVKESVFCQVPYAEENIYIHVDMTFVGPELAITPCFLDFGLVRHLDHHTQECCVLNRSSIPLTWSIEKAKDNICAGNDEMITVKPLGGFLEPFEKQNVIVNLNACHAMILRSVYVVKVSGGQERFLEISANVQRPRVCMDCSTLKITRCFLDIPVIQRVKLYNQTLLTSKYRFYKVIGKDFSAATVSFYPSEGILKPRESIELEITFIGKKEGQLNDFLALFEVEGAADIIPLHIEAHVEGLSVEYSIPTEEESYELRSNDSSASLEIDFGRFALLGKVVERSFVIKNKTAISSKFVIAVEFFSAYQDPKTLEDTTSPARTQGKRSVLKKMETSSNALVAAEKQLEALAKKYLSKGKGACFVPTPSEGLLGPFAQQTIILSAFSDMWGDYNDAILCKVGDLTVQRIPIHINVVGSPLNLQMSKEQPSIIRFGSCLSGSEPVTRKVRVNNTSPCDIRTHWEQYVLDWHDTQLLDLVVFIGKAFPNADESETQDDDEDVSDPLIRVHLSVHQGQQTTRPFDTQPKQMMVPAKSHATIEVHFHPLEGIRIPSDFIGYALGYMCLEKKDLNAGDRCHRLDGENTLPFTINMTGTVKPARIWLECHEDNGFNFYIPVSNLFKEREPGKYQLQNEWNLCHAVSITNSSGAKLMLNVTTEEPFHVDLVSDSRTKKSKKTASEYGRILDSCTSCEVKINFKLSVNLLESIANTMDPTKGEADAGYKVTQLDRELRINFSNGSCQRQTLTAHLMWPCVHLSTTEIDCGVCFIGQTISKELSIFNSGEAAYHWVAQNDPNYPEASQHAFQLSPRSGYLNAILGKHANKPKQSLSITFCPRQNVSYEARILLVGQLYDPLLSIRLKGSGSFDQATRRSSTGQDL